MSAGRHVLVVEDDAVTRKLLQVELNKRGYSVETAADGIRALTAVDSKRPDLVLLDIVLPELDGMSLLRALKGREETRSIPVIMITSVAEPSKMIEAISAGARYFVVKPFQVSALMSKIETAIKESVKAAP